MLQVHPAAGRGLGEVGVGDLHLAGNPVVAAEEGIDVVGGHFPGGHCPDHCGGTGNRIPAGKQVPQARDAGGQIRLDGPPVGGDPDSLKRLGDNGLANGHNQDVAGEPPFRQIRLYGVWPVLPVVGADVLGLGPEGRYLARCVGFNPAGGFQGDDFAAFRHGRLDLFRQSGHIFQPAPVQALDGSRPQPFGRAGGVHGHVAASDDADPFAGEIRNPAFPDVPEQPDSTVHSLGVFPGDMELLVAVGPDGDVHRIILLLELFHRNVRPYGNSGTDLDPGGEDVVQVPVQHFQGQTVVRDPVPEHAAQLGPLFVHGDAVAHKSQIVGCCQASRAASNHRHGLAGGRGGLWRPGRLGMVHGKPLQPADVHRGVHHPPAAVVFAGMLAYIGAGGGEGIVLPDQFQGVFIPAFPDERHITGNIHMGRAGGHTGHRVAETADAPAGEHVLLIILPEAPDPLQYHIGRLVADGTVRRRGDAPGGPFNKVDGVQGGRPVQHPFNEHLQLAQAHPAGHAFAAALGMAEPEKVQGHVHRAQPRRTGTDPSVHILIQTVQDRLGPSRCFNL